MAGLHNHVAEIQGLYGPFTMAERVVQKIWLQGDFDRRQTVLTDGRALDIRATGAWNLLGGPDFRGARIVIDHREISGDVEVHFHAADWRAHGHAADRAYARVVLHVVLFPPGPDETPARDAEGRPIPTLVLLPLLHRALEEYASDDALETITARDEWRHLAELAARPATELQELLRSKAEERWRLKVHFARRRIDKLGWAEAAHHTALEIFGYRQNRAAMLSIAARYPVTAWTSELEPAEIFAESRALWQLHGVRPANHPLARLRQYARWIGARPGWWAGVGRIAAELPVDVSPLIPTLRARKSLALGRRREVLAAEMMAGALGGTRLDNLVCDGFLPLLAARDTGDCFALWFHWFVGDVPDQVRRALPKLGIADGRMQPLCHGYAQGLLGWFLQRDVHASR